MADEFKIAALRIVSWVDHDLFDETTNGRDYFELLLTRPLGQLGAQIPYDCPVPVSGPRLYFDDVVTPAYSFVLQLGTLGLKLFEPRHNVPGISPIFRQSYEILYRALGLAKALGQPAICFAARGL
ncbi:MAG: hypothetical protein WBF03_14920 [Xanthobacteraceae bacterium]